MSADRPAGIPYMTMARRRRSMSLSLRPKSTFSTIRGAFLKRDKPMPAIVLRMVSHTITAAVTFTTSIIMSMERGCRMKYWEMTTWKIWKEKTTNSMTILVQRVMNEREERYNGGDILSLKKAEKGFRGSVRSVKS